MGEWTLSTEEPSRLNNIGAPFWIFREIILYALIAVRFAADIGETGTARGSLVTPDRLRFVSTSGGHDARRNQKVSILSRGYPANLEVYAEEMSYQKAVRTGATALFDEKYGDKVRGS